MEPASHTLVPFQQTGARRPIDSGADWYCVWNVAQWVGAGAAEAAPAAKNVPIEQKVMTSSSAGRMRRNRPVRPGRGLLLSKMPGRMALSATRRSGFVGVTVSWFIGLSLLCEAAWRRVLRASCADELSAGRG